MEIVDKINEQIQKLVEDNKISAKNISDGHHTFEELYLERVALLAIICNSNPNIAWKSKRHFDEINDPMFNGDFIIGINTPEGMANYHLKLKYWDIFTITEIDYAPKFNNHTPEDDINKLFSLNKEYLKKKKR